MSKILQLKSISKSFPDGERMLNVLTDITLDVNHNESIAITGRSGSGKSTLLHIIGLLDKPSSGSFLFGDTDVESLPESEKNIIRNSKIGFIFQHFHLLKELNVIENVMLPASLNGITQALNERSEHLLELVGLSDRINHKPNKLSGGEMQRVAIARALINSPDLILCDEPTGNLDKDNADKVISLLFDITAKENSSLILVTHDSNLASLASKKQHLEKGCLA